MIKKFKRIIVTVFMALCSVFVCLGLSACGEEEDKNAQLYIGIWHLDAFGEWTFEETYELDDTRLKAGATLFGTGNDSAAVVCGKKGYTFKGVYKEFYEGSSTEQKLLIDENGVNLYDLTDYMDWRNAQKYYQVQDLYIALEPIVYEFAYFWEEGRPILNEDGSPMVTTFTCESELPLPNSVQIENPGLYDKEDYHFKGWTSFDGTVKDCFWIMRGTIGSKAVYPNYALNESTPTLITSAEDFLKIKDNPSGKYRVVQDFTITDDNYTPFDFSGELDGRNHTITTNLSSSKGNVGLFNNFTGKITNTKLTVDIQSDAATKVNVGGIAAIFSGTCFRVQVDGEIAADYSNVGGFFGEMNGGSLVECENYAKVSSKNIESGTNCGGVIGIMTNGLLYKTYNHGEVSGYYNCGGIVGKLDNAPASITFCENVGEVTGKDNIGGVIGYISITATFRDNNGYFCTVNNVTNSSAVNGREQTGGVIGNLYCEQTDAGDNDTTYTLVCSKWTNEGTVTGESEVGGVVGRVYMYLKADVNWANPNGAVKISEFNNTGAVTGVSSVGGLLGYGYTDSGSSVILSSSSSGKITAEHTIGGLCGKIQNISLHTCTNTGTQIVATGYEIEGGSYYARVGGFAGCAYKITECHNQSDILYESLGCYIGGVAGYATGTITDCSNKGDITATQAKHVGGVIGYILVAKNYESYNLKNEGKVSAYSSVGGVLGSFYNRFEDDAINANHWNVTMRNYINRGEVSSEASSEAGFTGGCVGIIWGTIDRNPTYNFEPVYINFTLANFENYANVTTKSTTSVGGLIGVAYSDKDYSGSKLHNRVCSGLLNGETVDDSKLIGNPINFEVVEL